MQEILTHYWQFFFLLTPFFVLSVFLSFTEDRRDKQLSVKLEKSTDDIGSAMLPGSLAPWLPGSLAPWLPGYKTITKKELKIIFGENLDPKLLYIVGSNKGKRDERSSTWNSLL